MSWLVGVGVSGSTHSQPTMTFFVQNIKIFDLFAVYNVFECEFATITFHHFHLKLFDGGESAFGMAARVHPE